MRLLVSAALFSLIFVFPADRGSGQLTSDGPNIDSTKGFLEVCATVDEKPAAQSTFELFKSGYCVGLMKGLTTGIHGAEIDHHVSGRDAIFCIPHESSLKQMVHITQKYIADHPEEEHLSTGPIAAKALGQAFPCGNQPK